MDADPINPVMHEKILTAVRSASQPYLAHFLSLNPPEYHAQMCSLFDQHMSQVADYCMGGYGGAGTLSTAFVRGLHKSLFPPGYVQHAVNPQGEKVVFMAPGEYKVFPNHTVRQPSPGAKSIFADPVEVPTQMEELVENLNTALVKACSKCDLWETIIFFALDFSRIHPFADANGRVACILVDLLLIKEGLSPVLFCAIKTQDREGLYRAAKLARRNRDLTPLYEVVARYNPEALADV